jgi:hypothetical protein
MNNWKKGAEEVKHKGSLIKKSFVPELRRKSIKSIVSEGPKYLDYMLMCTN